MRARPVERIALEQENNSNKVAKTVLFMHSPLLIDRKNSAPLSCSGYCVLTAIVSPSTSFQLYKKFLRKTHPASYQSIQTRVNRALSTLCAMLHK
jgi:hypothetical protein